MKRNLHRIRLQAQDLADLAGGEIGAVAQRDQIARTLVEAPHRGGNREPLQGLHFQIFAGGQVRLMTAFGPGPCHGVVDAAAGDPDQPRQRLPTGRVVALAVAQGAFEDLARNVFGIGPVA